MTIIDCLNISAVRNLPALPAAILELFELLSTEGVATTAIAAKIGLDPALAAKTLQLANSSFYGISRHVSSLNDAASVLGQRTLRSVVTTAALIANLPQPSCNGFEFGAFWSHAIAVAVGAKLIAAELGGDEEAAFTAGLLHDIGRLVLASGHPNRYAEVLAHGDGRGRDLVDRERELLGVDHSEVGVLVADHWKIPKEIVEAIGDHHTPPPAKGAATLAHFVCLGDLMAHAVERRGIQAQAVFEQACKHAGIPAPVSEKWMEESAARASSICSTLLAAGA